jgi:pilus assembly protein CpaB
MNWKTWFPLVLAIVLGVVAAKAAHDWVLKNKAATNVPNGKFTKVIVANADMAPGRSLTAEDLTLADFETKVAPTNAFTEIDKLVGRVNETFMVKGQPIVEAMLAPEGSGSGLQAIIPEGQRAITLEVNEFTGVAGLLVPNCRVDIVSTLAGNDNNGQIARIVVQNVKVTAVGQKTGITGEPPPANPNEMPRSVTVLVTPDQAEAIELACSTSRPRLVLRGGRDQAIVATAGISVGQLRGTADHQSEVAVAPTTMPTFVAPSTQPASVAIARAEPPKRVVRVFRAGQESKVTLDVIEAATSDTITDTKKDTDPFIQE